MDEWQYELAEKRIEEAKERTLADIQAANAPQSHPDFDGINCVSCGTSIPSARLAMGKVRCTECQELYEKRNG